MATTNKHKPAGPATKGLQIVSLRGAFMLRNDGSG